MKHVIFICLLSISVCLSASVPPSAAPSLLASEPEKHDALKTVTEVAPTPTSTNPPAQGNANLTLTKENVTSTAKENTTSAVTPTKDATTNKSVEKPTTEGTPSSPAPLTTSSTVTPTKEAPNTPPASSTIPAPLTVKPEPDHKSTVPPKTTEPTPTLQARGFDGASFVGGIILTLGLLAIGFMGFKYYKNQTERNYHTL